MSPLKALLAPYPFDEKDLAGARASAMSRTMSEPSRARSTYLPICASDLPKPESTLAINAEVWQ
jgi:hypothetical protein